MLGVIVLAAVVLCRVMYCNLRCITSGFLLGVVVGPIDAPAISMGPRNSDATFV